MDIIEHLMLEHREIEKQLAVFSELNSLSEIQSQAKKIGHLVEGIHHKKEEDLLFPLIVNDSRIHQGGPNCINHMGMRIMLKLNEQIHEKLTQDGCEIIEHLENPDSDKLMHSNHPLSIPLEEHKYGISLIHAVLKATELKKAKEYVHLYITLLQEHIKKEDTCLFQMCLSLIPKEKRDFTNL